MRVVDRATFLNLPDGTIFSKLSEGDIDPDPHMMIKVASLFETNDFVYQSFLPAYQGVKDSGSHFDLMFSMGKGETSPPVDYDCTQRDGLYDSEQKFFVWDKEDVQSLLNRLQRALSDGYGTN